MLKNKIIHLLWFTMLGILTKKILHRSRFSMLKGKKFSLSKNNGVWRQMKKSLPMLSGKSGQISLPIKWMKING